MALLVVHRRSAVGVASGAASGAAIHRCDPAIDAAVCRTSSDAQVAARRSARGEHGTATFAEADATRVVALAPRAKNHGVAILEKRPRFSVRQGDGTLSALGQFNQRTGLARGRTGLRAAAH